MDWPVTALFFVPPLLEGWRARKELPFSWLGAERSMGAYLVCIPVLLWLFEFLSPPIVWDAVLDHFRYAREVSRVHQIPFHWVNHTGDMPKAAELVLAGFWNLGGEPLSKLSLAIPWLLTLWLLGLFGESDLRWIKWIFITCPYFLATYAFGYVEGFLAFWEVTALFCFWKGLEEPKATSWFYLSAYFLGMAFTVKYTAVLAIGPVLVLGIYWKWTRKASVVFHPATILFFFLPVFPWALKNGLAFGNPIYPLAASLFHSAVGYSPEMERGLLEDTGIPWSAGPVQIFRALWNCFFTESNGINAALTPLVIMSLPWAWGASRKKGFFLVGSFCGLFLLGWIFISTSLRHASGGVVLLALLAAMIWASILGQKDVWGRTLCVLGLALSFWLCLSTQLNTTAPYASALGLEDPLLRLKRHYTYDTDTYAAYRFIESHSDPADKVMAFGVWQTYPLQRTAFVDFKWKKPIFLDWASHCRTAGQLAQKLHEEGVTYFLYQQWEARAMSKMEKDFKLEVMSSQEYLRFWQFYTEPVLRGDNTSVYLIRNVPLAQPRVLDQVPGLSEGE